MQTLQIIPELKVTPVLVWTAGDRAAHPAVPNPSTSATDDCSSAALLTVTRCLHRRASSCLRSPDVHVSTRRSHTPLKEGSSMKQSCNFQSHSYRILPLLPCHLLTCYPWERRKNRLYTHSVPWRIYFFNPFFTKTYFHLRMLQSVAKLSSGRIVAGCPRLSAVQNQAVHQQSIYRARLSQGRSVLYNSADGSVCYWKYIAGALTRTLCSSAVSSSTMAPKVEWGMQAIFIKSLLLLILVSFFS